MGQPAGPTLPTPALGSSLQVLNGDFGTIKGKIDLKVWVSMFIEGRLLECRYDTQIWYILQYQFKEASSNWGLNIRNSISRHFYTQRGQGMCVYEKEAV